MLPKVSVVMPAYNAEKYIGRAVESILNQTYTDLELVIVEDGSTDNTPEIISSYHDSRVKLIWNNQNRGIAYSTNLGIEKAKGSYIALMDDDDMAAKDRLELQVEYLEEHPDIDILGGRAAKIDEEDHLIAYFNTPRSNPLYIKAMLLFNNLDFANGTAMIRKQFIETNNLRYRDNCYGMQDFRFFIDSSKKGRITSIDRVLLYYRLHDHNESRRNHTVYEQERRKTHALFQKESLRASGYKLDGNDIEIINNAIDEMGGMCKTAGELKKLYVVLNKIMLQARTMKVDYYKELEIICKKKLGENIMKLNIFE